MQYNLSPIFTPKEIFDKIPQIVIMEYYLGIPVKFNKLFKSPLREDKNPTCGFTYIGKGVLLFKDFSGHFSGDCIEVVKFIKNVNYQNALLIIAEDFNLIATNTKTKDTEIYDKIFEIEKIQKTKSSAKLNIKIRKPLLIDKNYWKPYGITLEILKKYNVYFVQTLWINGNINYTFNKYDPAYAYRLTNNEYKIYFPFRKPKNIKPYFICNTSKIQGYIQLPASNSLLIITKSMKDIMTLYAHGIYSIAEQAESILPKENIIKELKKRFTKIYTLYDNDKAGIKMADKIQKNYNIQPKFFKNVKDSGEFVLKYGSKEFIKWIQNNLKCKC